MAEIKTWLQTRISEHIRDSVSKLTSPKGQRWQQAEMLVVDISSGEMSQEIVPVPVNWFLSLFISEGKIPHIISVRGFKSKSQMRLFMKRGIEIEGRLFKPVGQTASMARQNRVFFTDKDPAIVGQIAAFLSQDTAYDGTDKLLSKTMARMFQSTSAGITVGGAAYLRDYNNLSEDERKLVNTWVVVIDDIVVNGRVVTDGSGIMNYATAKHISNSLREKGAAKVVQIRLGGGKGTLQISPKSIWYEMYKTHIVPVAKQAGVRVTPDMPFVIITKSMEKFIPGVKFFPLTVLRSAVAATLYVRTTYQLLQNLKNDANVLGELAQETFDKFYKVTPTTPPHEVLNRLGIIAQIGEEDQAVNGVQKEAVTLFRIVRANPQMALQLGAVRRKIMQLFQERVLDISRGRVVVEGSFTIMLPDPGVFVGKPFLKSGEYYSMGINGEAMLARFPMTSPGEPQVVKCVNHTLNHFDGYNVTIFNPYDGIWEQMSGADFDGDICLVTTDKRIIGLKLNGFKPSEFPKNEGAKKPCTYQNMCDNMADSALLPEDSKSEKPLTVGMTANILSSIISKMHESAGNSDTPWTSQWGEIFTYEGIIQEVGVALNDVIDYAKTGYMPVINPIISGEFSNKLPHYLGEPTVKFLKEVEQAVAEHREIIRPVFNNGKEPYLVVSRTAVGSLAQHALRFYNEMTSSCTAEEISIEYSNNIDPSVKDAAMSFAKDLRIRYTEISREFIKLKDLGYEEEAKAFYQEKVSELNELCKGIAATIGNKNLVCAMVAVSPDTAFPYQAYPDGFEAFLREFDSLGITYKKEIVTIAADNSLTHTIENGVKKIPLRLYGMQYCSFANNVDALVGKQVVFTKESGIKNSVAMYVGKDKVGLVNIEKIRNLFELLDLVGTIESVTPTAMQGESVKAADVIIAVTPNGNGGKKVVKIDITPNSATITVGGSSAITLSSTSALSSEQMALAYLSRINGEIVVETTSKYIANAIASFKKGNVNWSKADEQYAKQPNFLNAIKAVAASANRIEVKSL